MTRRLVLLAATAGVLVSSAGLASAATSVTLPPLGGHELCVVMSHDPEHNKTDDFCVNY